MFDNKRLDGILVIMEQCWRENLDTLPSDLKEGELEGIAAELLKRIRFGDPKMVLEAYLISACAKLGMGRPNATSEIVDRVTDLVRGQS